MSKYILKYIAIGFIAAALLALALPATSFGTKGNSLVLTDQEVAMCKSEGGCILVTKAFLDAVAQELARLRGLNSKACI